MKLIMENFRKAMREFKEREGKTMSYDSSLGGFVVSKEDLSKINKAIEKIYKEFEKRTGGTAEDIPKIEVEDLEPVARALNESAEQDQKWSEMEDDFTEEEKTNLFLRFGANSWEELSDANKELILKRFDIFTPAGQLKQKIGAVRDVEKGLGRLTPEDYEKGEYVLPVSGEVLEDFNKMVEELKEGGEVDSLFEKARDWYHKIRELLDQETGNDQDATLLGLLIATYSPRAKFALNLAEAAFMFKAVQMDAKENKELLEDYINNFPGGKKKEQGEFRGFTNAHKVPNFTLNLIAPELAGGRDEQGRVNYKELYMWNSTIDTWMIDAFYPNIRGVTTAKEWEKIKGKMMGNVVTYRYMAGLVAQEAKKLGILPHELQAIVWVASQIRKTGEKGLGVTTEFAINQIKRSIVNLEKIKQQFNEEERISKKLVGPYLKELDIDKEYTEQFGEQSWLKVVLDKIETEGFDEAADYILGIKKGDKTVVPGVRSITASGPKGKEPDRYPAPPPKPKKDKKEKKEKKKKPKDTRYQDVEKYGELKTFYVMNEVIQMPTGKFNNLHDSILMYLSEDFSKEKAVNSILGRFDPQAKASKDYFIKESKRRFVVRILKS
jgi:hypothetical protein